MCSGGPRWGSSGTLELVSALRALILPMVNFYAPNYNNFSNIISMMHQLLKASLDLYF